MGLLSGAVDLLAEVRSRVERLELPFSSAGIDPYGISKKELVRFAVPLGAMYRHYFDVKHHGLEHVPRSGRAMLIGNHSGGVALDASIVIASMFFELEPPRLCHSMVEKFLSRVPFAGLYTSRCGQMIGLPEHAERLLEEDRLLLVFPEGSHGTEKLYSQRHSLVNFGTGFMRLALQTRSPIVPFAFLGGGEAIPTVFNAYKLGRLVGAPYIPVTPWLVPLPMPTRLDVVVDAPMVFSGDGTEEDEVIEGYVAEVKGKIAQLIERGRRLRGELPSA
jgi:1-acyl-sn-glycerol-3-phosphate acyltransferase